MLSWIIGTLNSLILWLFYDLFIHIFMKTVLNRCKYSRESEINTMSFPLKLGIVENTGRQTYKLQFGMIAALKGT